MVHEHASLKPGCVNDHARGNNWLVGWAWACSQYVRGVLAYGSQVDLTLFVCVFVLVNVYFEVSVL